jgi:DNA-binding transcriptional LysR family regulator
MRTSELPSVVVFSRVAHHGSFTHAARELGVSASALSQTIRGLEQRMGVRLLQRTTRRVGLTEVGARFLAEVLPALEQIEGAFGVVDALRGKPTGLLRINIGRTANDLVVAPVLAEFHAMYPDLRIELFLDDGLADLVAGGFDAGIRLGECLAQDVTAVRVSGMQRMQVVASPAYLALRGIPQTPQDLHAHATLGKRFMHTGNIYRWEFSRDGHEFDIELESPILSNDTRQLTDMARAGLGFTQVFADSVRDDVARGTLIPVLEEWSEPFPGYYLYFPTRQQLPTKLRVFIDFLTARVDTASPALIQTQRPRKADRQLETVGG